MNRVQRTAHADWSPGHTGTCPGLTVSHGRFNFAAPAKLNTIDGLRVDWPDGFGLMRSSNTTPVLVLRFEGHTNDALHRIEADMLALLRQVKPDAKIGASAH